VTGRELTFLASGEHSCSYLAERRAGTLFVDPGAPLDPRTYGQLLRFGFRRSGDYVYRPRCPSCSACIPLRIPVAEFQPRRAERRTWAKNGDVEVTASPPGFQEEQYALYLRYVRARHPGGGMDDTDPARYLEFLRSTWGDTRFYEFRIASHLVAVAVVDHVEDAISACYTFFEPDLQTRGLGTYAILWTIDRAQRLGLGWLYLGYWIRECRKMRYKDRLRPVEAFVRNRWIRFGQGETIH